MSPLVLFYMGSHPDHRGRYLSEILAQDDLWLEVTHDYIQWVFPNRVPSKVTPSAPLLNKKTIELFRSDEILQQHLQASLIRMLQFYGLRFQQGQLLTATNWDERKTNWFTQDTHNNLRITRILLCLNDTGFSAQAQQIYSGLKQLKESQPDCGIDENTYKYWKSAALNHTQI